MFPSFTRDNTVNSLTRHRKPFGYFSVRDFFYMKEFSNVSNLFFAESSSMNFVSLGKSFSAFRKLISIVFRLCTKKKMSGVTARWIITFVANTKVFWYNTVSNLPGITMRKNTSIHNFKCAITPSISAELPLPAVCGSVIGDMVPEVKPEWWFFSPSLFSVFSNNNSVDFIHAYEGRSTYQASQEVIYG